MAFFSSRIGRRRGILISLTLLAIPTALLAVAPDLTIFTILRIAQGLFMPTASALTLSYLAEHCSTENTAGAFAAYITGNVASNLLGRLMSAALADHFAFINTFIYVNFVLVRAPLALSMMAVGFVYFVFLPEKSMFTNISKSFSAVVLSFALFSSSSTFAQTVGADGLIKVKSAYGLDETVTRLKKDIADKGIMFFSVIDQAQLAAGGGIQLRLSTLLIFSNPPLGTQFMTSNPYSGLDWPVRLLVIQDEKCDVWTAYTDFAWIARRHGITDREQQFKMASGVVDSITSSVRAK